jgi:hypothetical protein
MSIIVQDKGCQNFLDTLTNQGGVVKLDAVKARLYTNNHTPVHTDVIGAFTEATFGGYAAQAMSGWGASTISASVASSTAANVTFNNTSGAAQTIYGYYVTDSGATVCYFAEIFTAGPLSLPSGLSLVLSITFTVQSLN